MARCRISRTLQLVKGLLLTPTPLSAGIAIDTVTGPATYTAVFDSTRIPQSSSSVATSSSSTISSSSSARKNSSSSSEASAALVANLPVPTWSVTASGRNFSSRGSGREALRALRSAGKGPRKRPHRKPGDDAFRSSGRELCHPRRAAFRPDEREVAFRRFSRKAVFDRLLCSRNSRTVAFFASPWRKRLLGFNAT